VRRLCLCVVRYAVQVPGLHTCGNAGPEQHKVLKRGSYTVHTSLPCYLTDWVYSTSTVVLIVTRHHMCDDVCGEYLLQVHDALVCCNYV